MDALRPATPDSSPQGAPGPRAGPPAAGWGAPALVALLVLLHLAWTGSGPGRGFGDDYAQYVLHARNLVEGRPYGDTGYIFNPLNAWFSPRTYPPGFPLLLAPVYAALGPDFHAMKVLVVLALGGALLAIARLARRDLPPAAVFAAVALAGLHPYLWEFRENLLPDLPFTFFCLLALLPLSRAGAPGLAPRERAGWAAAAAPAVALAVSTRTIGVVLVPTLLAVLVMRSRRPLRAALACAGAGAALLVAALALAPPDSGYLRQLSDLAAVDGVASLLPDLEHVRRTGFALTELWDPGDGPAIGKAAALAAALLAAAGIAPRLRRPGAPELFLLFYGAGVFLWPAVQARYFVPVLPLWILYAVAGAERGVRAGGAARAAVAAAALPVAVAYAVGLGSWDPPGASGAGIGPPAAELYGYVRAHTPPGARLVAAEPRALRLFTGRAAAPPSRDGSDADALAFMEAAGIEYLALRVSPDQSRGLVERNPGRFARVFAGRWYEVYRLRPPPRPVGVGQAGYIRASEVLHERNTPRPGLRGRTRGGIAGTGRAARRVV